MRCFPRYLGTLALFVSATLLAPRPARSFDPEAYRSHLDSTRTWTSERLLASRAPFGPYDFQVSTSPIPDYLDSIVSHFALTTGETELLRRHGFVVSERLGYRSFGEAFRDIWHADLPVFVSSDAILHAVHRSYVDILATLEANVLKARLEELLARMHWSWPALNARYRDTPGMRASLDDVDVYLTVARSLLAGQPIASAGNNGAEVADLLRLIAAEQPASAALFNATLRLYDFSQFTLRGHYTQSLDLARYFKAMIWLGRTEMRLTPPPGLPADVDVTREIVDAFLVSELLELSDGVERLQSIEEFLCGLVGPPDNIGAPELDRLGTAVGLSRADELFDSVTRARFESELATGTYTAQAINSQILITDPFHPEALDPPYAFFLLGQRCILDSYVAWNVVYDRIEHDDGHPFRGLPSGLDILYALGNDDVLPLLADELRVYHYAPNLAALRYLVDSYEPEFWSESLYKSWLAAIRALSRSGRQPGVPDFMRTGAWQQEKMNTQLASWTELRHDNLLYAKQSYTGGAICSFPRRVRGAGSRLLSSAGGLRLPCRDDLHGAVVGMRRGLAHRALLPADGGHAVASGHHRRKELMGELLTTEEQLFLGEMLEWRQSCVLVESGWYRDLYFSAGDSPTQEEDLLIADVHTQPTDEGGNPVGHVLHAATGRPEMGLFIAAPPGQALTAFAGPVSAYFEHVTVDFRRLTDEQWRSLYEQGPPARPDWTHVYLADARGEVRSTGRRLVPDSTVSGEVPPPARARLALGPNVPNPFNAGTRLDFRFEAASPASVSLRIYDVQGRLVRVLLQETLPRGTYHVRWDGDDWRHVPVASGVYWARIDSEGTSDQRKLVVLR